ncbi:MAG: TRAP transporter small permease subunit [Hydrogenophaga sp.]|nr:TRAP transporter small permease subunit [Hydrogenophaga sp.]
MLLINADVVGRGAFGSPVRGVTELVSLSIVGIVFLQLADALRCGRLTQADVFLGPLRQRQPALGAALQAVFHGLGALLMGLILHATWPQLVDAVRIGEYVGALGDFTAPVWPVRLVVLLGLVATVLTFALLAVAEARMAWRLRRGGA